MCCTIVWCLWKACREKGVDCIVAPYEADAQLAYLNKCGIAQLVITEDSDLILFGCDRVRSLFKCCVSCAVWQKLKPDKTTKYLHRDIGQLLVAFCAKNVVNSREHGMMCGFSIKNWACRLAGLCSMSSPPLTADLPNICYKYIGDCQSCMMSSNCNCNWNYIVLSTRRLMAHYTTLIHSIGTIHNSHTLCVMTEMKSEMTFIFLCCENILER